MKKRYILSAVGAIGAGYLLTNKEKREKLKDNVKFYAKKLQNNNTDDFFNTTLEDAGRPDQTTNRDLAQFENAKMVSEGSQFGVNYYNEVKENIEAKEKNQ